MPAPQLSLATLGSVPTAARPAYDPRDLRIGLVHLGAGAFFRAHQACYTHAVAAAGDSNWGIMATSQRSPEVADQLSAQDGLYSVLERPTRGAPKIDVVGVIRRTACAAREPEDIVAALADPAVHVVTLTVTEKGYRAVGGRLHVDSDVEADLLGRPPATVVGQLVRGLQRRAAAGAGPITLISCDNLSDNGTILRQLVRDFAERLTGPGTDILQDFIERHTTFPSTMVDRIVPATADSDRAEVQRLLSGVRDDAAVVAEPFSQWVIADEFGGPRPSWEAAGAILTTDVAGYERVKLRLLNATHSLIAYLGALAGYRTIAEALADARIEQAARQLIDDDQLPTIVAPDGLDLIDYRESVLDRFANPALGHRTAQVAMDGSQKLPQRVLSAVRERRAHGVVPSMAALLVAAWMRFLIGRDDNGDALQVSDPMAERLTPMLTRAAPDRDVVREVFAVHEIFGADLADDTDLMDAVAYWFDALRRHGVEQTLKGA
ncbi:mannitol dehydrogenase family protein [Phytoactinopolyspora mesophila]|uniref:Mannitol dehydrogenase family protein n=1 Tax=Phytoactinopolyspora mesophila TaxID=2650750 RepID=A0A7K3M6U8_9ACTN|nr:mannitol dehydrogenase family protein [Phytoactinopolyspora mesophila]NDL58138.1 mannitol dehydrogenase family protein [Phytoactinopolyspora mesophila]